MTQQNAVHEIRLSVRQCLSQDLGRDVSAVDDAASLLEAGVIDSLAVLQLVAQLEKQYGFTVADDDLVPEHFDSIEAIAAFIAEKRDAQRS